MTPTPEESEYRNWDRDEIDLKAVVAALRKDWRVILLAAFAAVLLQLVTLYRSPAIYRVEMQVSAVMATHKVRQGPPTPAELTDQFFTSMVRFQTYIQSLRTHEVADELAKDPVVLRTLFHDQWDGVNNVWRPKPSSVQRMEISIESLLGWPVSPWRPPSGAQVQQFLINDLVVERDQKTLAFATIRMQSAQPEFAVRLLAALNRITNDHVRMDALTRARQIIADLNTVPSAQTDEEMALARQQQRMIEADAISTAPFAAQVVGSPAAWPDPVNTPLKSLIAAFVLGGAAGAAFASSLRWLGLGLGKTANAGRKPRTVSVPDSVSRLP